MRGYIVRSTRGVLLLYLLVGDPCMDRDRGVQFQRSLQFDGIESRGDQPVSTGYETWSRSSQVMLGWVVHKDRTGRLGLP